MPGPYYFVIDYLNQSEDWIVADHYTVEPSPEGDTLAGSGVVRFYETADETAAPIMTVAAHTYKAVRRAHAGQEMAELVAKHVELTTVCTCGHLREVHDAELQCTVEGCQYCTMGFRPAAPEVQAEYEVAQKKEIARWVRENEKRRRQRQRKRTSTS